MSTSTPRIDVVLPVFNEADVLSASVIALHSTMSETFSSIDWQITIADNASTDGTALAAFSIAEVLPHIRVLQVESKGRGRALKEAWLTSAAEVVAYMDIDLSTDLRALAPLVAPLLSGHSDIAIGSRLTHSSRVVRGTRREVLSRGYNMLLHGCLGASFSDAQCGFKAMTAHAAHLLLPLVEDNAWFFDTELLILGERSGLRIAEVAVDWFDDPHSTVDVPSTVKDDLRGIGRLGWTLMRGRVNLEPARSELGRRPLQPHRPLSAQIVSFAVIGLLSTLVFSILYLLLSTFMPEQWANFCALAISAVANTLVNRRVTFGITDPSSAMSHLVQGIATFFLTWLLTSEALTFAAASISHPTALENLVILTAANAIATILRFLAYRVIFRPADVADHDVETRITRRELLGA